jgi:hypothetical protein
MPEVGALASPRLAHLNDIAAMQFARHVVWREAGGMGSVTVNPRGRSGDRAVVPFQLASDPAPLLADPPLQSRAGALHAIWVGADGDGRAAASWIDRPDDEARQRTFRIGDAVPLAAAVAWGRSEDPLEATLFAVEPAGAGEVRARAVRLPDCAQEVLYEGPGELVDFVVDQWAGSGTAYLVLRVAYRSGDDPQAFPRLEIVRWSFEEGAVSKSSVSALPPALGASPRAQWRCSAALPDAQGLALLFEGEEGWTAWANGASVAIPRPPDAVAQRPRLVATARDGVYFVFHEDARGFSALPVFPRADLAR